MDLCMYWIGWYSKKFFWKITLMGLPKTIRIFEFTTLLLTSQKHILHFSMEFKAFLLYWNHKWTKKQNFQAAFHNYIFYVQNAPIRVIFQNLVTNVPTFDKLLQKLILFANFANFDTILLLIWLLHDLHSLTYTLILAPRHCLSQSTQRKGEGGREQFTVLGFILCPLF